jgi:hypothetical protein
MVRSAGIMLVVFFSACASNLAQTRPDSIELTEKSHGLFVGHTDNGDVVVAATHYNAMNGLAVLDTDLGVPAKDSAGMMLCQRSVTTGSHMPRWICRYQDAIDRERAASQNDMNAPLGGIHIPASGPAMVLGSSGIGHGGRTASQ